MIQRKGQELKKPECKGYLSLTLRVIPIVGVVEMVPSVPLNPNGLVWMNAIRTLSSEDDEHSK